MKNNFLSALCFLGGLTVIMGAFGAHLLADVLDETGMKSYDTALRYQMTHVLLLLFIQNTSAISSVKRKKLNAIFLSGIFLFSGSIFALTLLDVPAKYVWFVTPIGGLLLIFGWVYLGLSFLNKQKN